MSVLGKIFGGGKKRKEKAPTTGDAINKIRDTEDMLIKKQEFLEKKIAAELDIAKKNGTKNKRVALQALKRKKRYETQLEQVLNTLQTIETQRDALENASSNTEILKGMKMAASAMKEAHNKLDVEDVHDVMDDIAEQQELARELNEAISRPGMAMDDDLDDLERELEELEQEELDKELVKISKPSPKLPVLDLPTPPVAAPRKPGVSKSKVKSAEDDDDLKELAAWAS